MEPRMPRTRQTSGCGATTCCVGLVARAAVAFFLVSLVAGRSLTDNDREVIVSEHNMLRRVVASIAGGSDVRQMSWDPILELRAEELAKACIPDYGSLAKNHFNDDNFFWFESGSPNVSLALKKWSGMTHGMDIAYDHWTGSCSRDDGCIPYLKMVWGITSYVGCSLVECAKAHSFICLYYPKGEIGKKLPFLVDASACSCPNKDFPTCDRGLCLKVCKPGTFGPKCDQNCSVNCDGGKEACDVTNGTCSSGCVAGYKPPFCIEACSSGTYGSNCTEACSEHCMGGLQLCSPVDGKCKGGKCQPGYTPPRCKEHCPNGTFGWSCYGHCSDNCYGGWEQCEPVKGRCQLGCIRGHRPPSCATKCPQLTYGRFCNESCSMYCTSGECDPVTGHCVQGCQDGFVGPLCTEEIYLRHDRKGAFSAKKLMGLLVVAALVTTCTIALFLAVREKGVRGEEGALEYMEELEQFEDIHAMTEQTPEEFALDEDMSGQEAPVEGDAAYCAVDGAVDGAVDDAALPQKEDASHTAGAAHDTHVMATEGNLGEASKPDTSSAPSRGLTMTNTKKDG